MCGTMFNGPVGFQLICIHIAMKSHSLFPVQNLFLSEVFSRFQKSCMYSVLECHCSTLYLPMTLHTPIVPIFNIQRNLKRRSGNLSTRTKVTQ